MIRFTTCFYVGLIFFLCGCDSPTTDAQTKPVSKAVFMDIEALQIAYENGTLTAAEVTADLLAFAKTQEPSLQAVIAFNPLAIAQAVRLDSLRMAGIVLGPLHGIPVYLKDNIETADGIPTTAGARVLADNDPGRDAFITTQLREAGAVILGKTNLSEWANFHSTFSSSGYSGVGGQTKNPHDVTRSPCGSSAGSGVAVAAGYAPLAIGTETNGSIVCPSHANGIVGIKPTVGLLSRTGIIPISESQDTPGPMARSVADAALALTAMQGVDPNDTRTSSAAAYTSRDYATFLVDKGSLNGKRIGLHTGPLGNHFRVDSLVRRTVRKLEAAGATVIEIEEIATRSPSGKTMEVLLYEFKDGLNKYLQSLPNPPYESLGAIIQSVDKSNTDMAWFDHELLRRANAKGSLAEKTYQEAVVEIQRIFGSEGIDRVMKQHQLVGIMAPTGGPAWKIDLTNGDNFSLGSSTPAAVAGYPNITVPMGMIDGLPVGMSFFGPAYSEPALIGLASAWEDLRGPFERPKRQTSKN